MRRQDLHQPVLHCQPDGGEVRGVLELRDDADHPTAQRRFAGGQLDDLLQRGYRELAVVCGGAQLRQAFACAQGAQLGQGEVLGEPTLHQLAIDTLAGLAVGELWPRGHVGGAVDLVLVTRHQAAIARADQVGFDGIGTVLDRLGIGRQGVLRAQGAGAAVGDHHGRAVGLGHAGLRIARDAAAGTGDDSQAHRRQRYAGTQSSGHRLALVRGQPVWTVQATVAWQPAQLAAAAPDRQPQDRQIPLQPVSARVRPRPG